MNKVVPSVYEAIKDIHDGASIFVGGFGVAGSPVELIHALIDHGAKDLTIISNNSGNGYVSLAALTKTGQIKKLVCSYPRRAISVVFDEKYRNKEIELELIPQGTLAERIRAGGAGVPAFYTPTAVGTLLAEGKEEREFNGKKYILELALKADFALIKAEVADEYGNLTYNKTARNFNPIMCTAAKTTIVQAKKLVPPGGIDPEHVVTPQIFVDRIVEVSEPLVESDLIDRGAVYPWN